MHFILALMLLTAPMTKEPGTITFTPPQGWKLSQDKKLPESVKAMVIGQGDHEMPPTLNLTVEPFDGTLKEYLEIVKKINQAKHSEWKDLGTLKTAAGNASLSQADMMTEWGQVRMMHVILLKDGAIYNLTAAALKSEFPKFYKEFFDAMRSLKFNA